MSRLRSLMLTFLTALAALVVVRLAFTLLVPPLRSIGSIAGLAVAWVLVSGLAAGAASARWFGRVSRPVGVVTLGLAAVALGVYVTSNAGGRLPAYAAVVAPLLVWAVASTTAWFLTRGREPLADL